ncbi:MAG TPA: hypothetical protein VMF87_28220 [Streptosporangiaceae bacterium]|nr:hypothetical protein [Streptosporangiaceae bacterium]
MNTLEDRLRAATRAAAATVAEGSAPPLTLPQPGRRGLPGRNGRPRWIVPLTAAAAVMALIAASIFVAHAAMPGTRRPAPAPPAAPLPRLADGLPAYFLESSISDLVPGPEPRPAGESGSPIPVRLPSHETLRVVATATGKVAATATLPGYVAAIAASRGAFFAAVVRDNLARFYEIRLNGSTATAVSELPIRPDTAPLAFLAASPDGTKLAYSTQVVHGASGKVQNLVVASTARGGQREWLTPAQDSQGSIGLMNWLADGRTLAFDWTASPETPDAFSLRLLDTAAPGTDLMRGRAVLPSVYQARPFNEFPTLSPNGQVVVGTANGSAASRAPGDSVLAFSAATGEETVLYRAAPNGPNGTGCYSPPVWISRTGGAVLVTCFRGHEFKTVPHMRYVVNVVLIRHGQATVLPWLDDTAEGVTAFP